MVRCMFSQRLAARRSNHNPEEGTVDLEFHGEEGFYQ